MKSRYKLLLMGLALVMVGTIAYAWTDFQAAPICQGEAARFDPQAPILANGWGFDPENTRAVRANAETLAAADIPHLKLQWAFRFPLFTNKARSQPAVTADTLYVGSQRGWVYAL
ncbi:MAG TPA: PQQ-binding-like beta-propeller repeat protein, partial [Candidatus Macondimonas sp.]|nr:PQQ-binding-like beta-propeller repeat protein [Candidatus Macondimonas sp.]